MMIGKMNKIMMVVAGGCLLASSVAFSGERSALLVTATGARAASVLSFELLNEDNVSALQFEIDLKGLGAGAVESRDCISGLPSSHTGGCNIVNGVLKVAIFSMTNEPLQTGTIGQIQLSAAVEGNLAIKNLLLGTGEGTEIKGEALFDDQVGGGLGINRERQ